MVETSKTLPMKEQKRRAVHASIYISSRPSLIKTFKCNAECAEWEEGPPDIDFAAINAHYRNIEIEFRSFTLLSSWVATDINLNCLPSGSHQLQLFLHGLQKLPFFSLQLAKFNQ